MIGGLGYYLLGHRLRFSAVVRAGLVDFCGTSGFGPLWSGSFGSRPVSKRCPLQMAVAEVCVTPGDVDVGVSEELAHFFERPGPAPRAHQQMASAGVAQVVEAHVPSDAGSRFLSRGHRNGCALVAAAATVEPLCVVARCPLASILAGKHPALLRFWGELLPAHGGFKQGDPAGLAVLGGGVVGGRDS